MFHSWNEPSDADGVDGPNARFKKAMSLTGGELCAYVRGLSMSWWPGRAIVAESLARRKEDHPSGEVCSYLLVDVCSVDFIVVFLRFLSYACCCVFVC